ncbi:unnamed protein product [Ilex paraguariensis]|uniref:Transmembrane and coiled-coil domain-containing protein 4 n=1 Tax=Ilex paraguariensis TaxID=185542 RepID=A0ABC8SIP0_9AQUA
MSSSMLTPAQRYAAGALFGLALHQAQIHQTRPLGSPSDDDPTGERTSSGSSSDSVSEDPQLWVHESSGLLRPVFRFLEVDSKAWTGLEETAGYSPAKHHVGAFLRLLAEESGDSPSEAPDKERALANGVDAMASSMEKTHVDYNSKKKKHCEYEHEWREKFSTAETQSKSEVANVLAENQQETTHSMSEVANVLPESRQETKGNAASIGHASVKSHSKLDETPPEEVLNLLMLSYSRKVTVLYELLSACLANIPEHKKKSKQQRAGYDARHRVALRLLATWFDVNWIKMEAIETMVACSAMALLKEAESKEENQSEQSSWAKWKRGGIIGAAALTGGTLMAITGGLAAPAIAAGFSALAPTLGTIIPVIGAGGFAAVASAAGSVAGSVAVAASFGAAGAGLTGSKMARRIGDVDEFEFKAIGENHNQGRLAVEILVSGFVFEEEDFLRPWEGQIDNSERYALQWESKHLIAVSTAIQDWLTSNLALELMKRGAMMTVLSSLMAALAWPATLLAATDFIDSKWTIAVNRSDKAGKLLAEVLLKGLQGHRPVTLVGFSLGARVIFECLQFLAETQDHAGLVERVVLLGAPVAIKDEHWEAARKVVAGRFVNAYATNDWMLGVAFRAKYA